MGEVYLALDTRLGRKIALKLLSTEFTSDEERVRRFEQEARAASALNHPNIITIFEIGAAGSSHFIATEYIEGLTLRDRIIEGPMPLGEAVDVAMQVASAMAAAHSSGIIHRDIKPENIMLRPDGYVKVLDFGLAKLTEKTGERQAYSSDPEAITKALVDTDPAIVMGTVSYMSPEQTRGLKVDERTDIFSLGVVLYEMCAGRKPFEGATISDVISLILSREPLPLARFSPEIPEELERIVAKALAKDREERYQTVKDLFIDLRRLKRRLDVEVEMVRAGRTAWPDKTTIITASEQAAMKVSAKAPVAGGEPGEVRTTSSAEYLISSIKRHKKGTTFALAGIAALLLAVTGLIYSAGGKPNPIESIAVLPFLQTSGDSSFEYLSDGFTESMINSLSRLPGVRVMSFSSVFRYKGQAADPRDVGRELGVQAVLTGRVAQRGDNVAIRVELVNALDNSYIWGEQYTRKFAEILLLQEDISKDISEKLRLRLTGEDRKRLEAYQSYLRGRSYWNRRTADTLKKAVEHFQHAIEKDPNYAPAYAGLADCYNMLVLYSAMAPAEGFPKAKEAAMKALALDESLAEAHTSLAFALFRWDWDWDEAEREFSRAIELNANYAIAHQWYSNYAAARGRMGEAISEARRIQELDPLSSIINSHLAWVLYFARQYDEAIAQCRKTLDLDPNFFSVRRYLGLCYEQKGMYNEAIAEYQRALVISGGSVLMKSHLAHAYARAGKKEQARQILQELNERATQTYVSAYLLAVIHAGLGETDLALSMLEKAYEERAEFMVYLKVDPRLDGLRSEARFQSLLDRMGLSQ